MPLPLECHMLDGTERRLFATSVSREGLFVLAMRPPPVGAFVRIVINHPGRPALLPIEARVTETCLDGTDASRCGFAVTFLESSATAVDALLRSLPTLRPTPRSPLPSPRGRVQERRAFPRIAARLTTLIELGDGDLVSAVMVNLSMSGALLSAPDGSLPAVLFLDAVLAVHLIDHALPESAVVPVRVVRVEREAGTTQLAVRFSDLGDADAWRVERMILEEVGRRLAIEAS